MVIDPISNLITTIRNASAAGKKTVIVPFSALKKSVLETVKNAGYIESVKEEGAGTQKQLIVDLKYVGSHPRISGIKRISKQSCRRYVSAKDIVPVKQDMGLSILTTSKGIMTSHEAKQQQMGGEVLFEIW